MNENNKIINLSKDNWPFLTLLGLLIILFLWVLIPGNVIRKPNANLSSDVTKLEKEKKLLLEEIDKLDQALQTASCDGEFLTLPDGSKVEDLLPPSISTDPDTVNLVEKLEASSVLVQRGDGGFGTGFFISEDIIMTNFHVVENAKSIGVGNSKIGYRDAKILKKGNLERDLALLQITNKVGIPLSIKSLNNKFDFKLTDILAAGYPGVVIQTDTNFFPDLTITRGTISSEQKIKGGFEAFYHTAKIARGNSGGPLTDKCGDVLGINTWGTESEQGKNEENFFISLKSEEILQFLKDSNIKPSISNKSCGK